YRLLFQPTVREPLGDDVRHRWGPLLCLRSGARQSLRQRPLPMRYATGAMPGGPAMRRRRLPMTSTARDERRADGLPSGPLEQLDLSDKRVSARQAYKFDARRPGGWM